MSDIMKKITQGEGEPEDIKRCIDMGETIKSGSLCGLGTTAPNPVLSSIRYFRDEWEAHVIEKKCPALVCKALINFYILPDKCAGCGICARACPVEAISGGKRLIHVIDQEKCIKCATCLEKCPERFSAVVKVTGEHITVPKEPVPVGTEVEVTVNMDTINLTIDGIEVKTTKGKRILEAALDAGIYIPNLCALARY